MRWWRAIAFGMILAAPPARAEGNVFMGYGQSADVWHVYNDVKAAQKDLFKINQILNSNFGLYHTAFTRIGGDFVLLRPARAWLKTIAGEISVEAAALGLVQNPVVPELVAAATAVTLVRFPLAAEPAEGWRFGLAPVFGWGIERRLSAVSTDLIESIPFQKGQVRVLGVDLLAAREWKRAEDRFAVRAAWNGTKYYGIDAQTAVALDRQLRDTTQWWETRADYHWHDWNVHAIGGSHPLPENILPRVWDRVANTTAWRELGAMSGAGVGWRKPLGAQMAIALTAGLYAGYGGYAARWDVSARTHVTLSSYGIENSSAYRTLGARVYAAQVNVGL